MVKPAPRIDRRNAAKIAQQVQELLRVYAPAWQEFEIDPVTGDRTPTGISAALIGVFARYCEIIIQRLNQVPDKNFLAFLNLLGASRLPPQPARVPLTFSLTAGSTVDAVVPAGTQVAAPPAEGEKEPVIFETERELVVSAAQLVSLFVREAAEDRYSDRSAIISTADGQGVSPFVGDRAIPHMFYIAHDRLFGFSPISQLDLTITLAASNTECAIVWEIWNHETSQWEGITPTSATSAAAIIQIQNLQQSGTLQFTNLTAIPVTAVNAQTHRWLRGRLIKRITPALTPEPDQIRLNQLPRISNIQLQATLGQSQLPVEAAFTNQLPVDATQVFFPFGEKPKLGDVFYLAHREAFSQSGVTVTLQMDILDPTTAGFSNNSSGEQPKPELTWEYWDGRSWRLIGTSTTSGPTSSANSFQDTTQAFRQPGNGTVSFVLPATPTITTINGVENFWIRVRISGGNYGREARYVPTGNQSTPFRLEPATFVPPIIRSLQLTYSITTPAQPEPPQHILLYNDFGYTPVDPATPFSPFQPTSDLKPQPHPRFYLGFSLPPNRPSFPNQPLSLYLRTADYSAAEASPASSDRPQLTWQYWQGSEWRKLTVRDDTENLTRPGLIEFLPPADLLPRVEFGIPSRYWLRVVWSSGVYPIAPRVSRILPNTTIAAQTVTIRHEILGSSNGTENQIFRTTRSPILAGQQLQVREPELPPEQEQKTIQQDEGEDAISTVQDSTGRPQEIWVRWHQVSDFYGSGARDRHYTLNRLTGEIQFGDGLNGLIPPTGIGNVRMTRYQTGGGTIGNRAASTIVQLKTTVPYIEKVTNSEAAAGGADAESLDSLVERMPRTLRHRGRAVTLEDYEDLAKLASPDVARARCIPLRNLQLVSNSAIEAENPQPLEPGVLSLIIVPYSNDPKPLPSLELLNRIQRYLQANSSMTARVVVVPPHYLSVNITTDLAVTSLEGASAVEQAVERKLSRFLHPLTGGLDGNGWDFGREPHKSDFYRQIESVSGVDHVRSLKVELIADEPGQDVPSLQRTGLFLVYSGKHTINLMFEDA
ncbi:putative baseplate assembly protein [Leptothermofonsia sichuanensis E412]|uniref:putative baseplate assembly protein n=1 Tax=Leptothermofonsia sichuanensis TaxID=2917832 RepID=UPI001CA6C6E2|nr:putative baseplate assembly protein [Leptothermofonsia sichuanensis]QZZ22018.1 putative baseplate assembly protein [Leptothermofonsia sichuanensis E412]